MGKKREKKKQKKSYIPRISFWTRTLNPDRYAEDIKNRRNIEVVSPRPALLPTSKALIYSSELEYIARCIQDFPNIETGGQLYGAWTASGAPRVIYVIGPGPKANHQSSFFNQDIEYLETIGAKLKEYGLQHIGEWHSHHHLGLPHPSGYDTQTMQNGIDQLNLNRLVLCIGSINDRGIIINPFNFARDAHFVDARWDIINSRNRLREVIDSDLRDILRFPHSENFVLAEPQIIPQQTAINNRVGWFSNVENRQEFKKIIDTLKFQNWVNDVTPQISEDGIVTLKITSRIFAEIIRFPHDFPNEPFEIDRMGFIEQTHDHFVFNDSWEYSSDLFGIFMLNYSNHLKNHR
ncbi:MAG: Mov34/MPN/PAD-1 family protein [Muribaculaceae bacterium]|nr:Mov34/MPN/PAD-1 family protein [Muribaculaceae bacterium]